MCDRPSISTSLPRFDARLPCPRFSNRVPSSKFLAIDQITSRIFKFLPPTASFRYGFDERSFKKGPIRSSSSTLCDDPGDRGPRKQKSLNGFIEINSGGEDGVSSSVESRIEEERDGGRASVPSSFDFLELKRELEKEEDSFSSPEVLGSNEPNSEELGGLLKQPPAKGGRRQMMRRSSLLAKQVISIQSARSLGFVSQLWVDTRSWMVVLVELRPNLLSGEWEKFLLDDISQVGDVVLVQDESVLENDLRIMGLDTLLGYNVVTSSKRNVGKVRGYTFNINSGAVELLELDSFALSMIPASLVSTYGLFVEDVLEVFSDTIVVQEGASSRVQKLSKGFLDARNVEGSIDEIGEYFDFRRSLSNNSSSRRKHFRNRKARRKMREIDDDWGFPMDY